MLPTIRLPQSKPRGVLRRKIASSALTNFVSGSAAAGSAALSAVGSVLPSLPFESPLEEVGKYNIEREERRRKSSRKSYGKLAAIEHKKIKEKSQAKNNALSKKAAKSIMYKQYKKELSTILSNTKAGSSISKRGEKLISKILKIEEEYPELKKRTNQSNPVNNILNQRLLESRESLLEKAQRSFRSYLSKSGSESASGTLSRSSTLTNFSNLSRRNLAPYLGNEKNAALQSEVLRRLQMNHSNSNYSNYGYSSSSNLNSNTVRNRGSRVNVSQEQDLLGLSNSQPINYGQSKKHRNLLNAQVRNRNYNPNTYL